MINSFLDKFIRSFRVRKVLQFILSNSVICDIGCGDYPKLLFDLEDKIKFGVGIDRLVVSKKWTDKLQTLNFDLNNNLRIPFSDNRFDYVLMLALLEHLKYPKEILEETKRILRPGGFLILTTPTPSAKPILEFLSFRLGLISREGVEEHKHYFARKELLGILKNLGFFEIKHRFFELGLNQIVIAIK